MVNISDIISGHSKRFSTITFDFKFESSSDEDEKEVLPKTPLTGMYTFKQTIKQKLVCVICDLFD